MRSFRKRDVDVYAVDRRTGEVLDGVPVLCGVKQEALQIIAKDKDIKWETYRVFVYILSILDFENWIQVPLSDIANELDMQRANVSRAIKILESKDILLRGHRVGKSYAFRLNPDFGWKGRVTNLDEYRERANDEEIRQIQRKQAQVERIK
jgi:DNA-binding transcriptional regulator GbsR (MarR family)